MIMELLKIFCNSPVAQLYFYGICTIWFVGMISLAILNKQRRFAVRCAFGVVFCLFVITYLSIKNQQTDSEEAIPEHLEYVECECVPDSIYTEDFVE